ncbi:maternal protein tudor isoform X3 [Cryptotermes secundus]|uniref:maternal protein tudor isoform X3 n=1 Tax=Cryptotermes secundus TaxID=105785 RepID=UPI000CD7B9B3|nr:maternal protein tudor isoform X3 [Cryptotermes secundus]
MSVLQQPIEIFVTYVEIDGPFLRLWAQLDRTQATAVERLILQLSEQFERGLGIPSTVQVGQLCCARYSDGVYYRARVTRPPDMPGGHVAVHFIDYGNSEVVPFRDIRSLEESLLTRLASVSDNATEFLLAGVVPVSGTWDENSLAFIRQTLCYEELKAVVVAQVANKRLIRVFYKNEDFAKILIASKVGVSIEIIAQQMLIQGYYNWNSVPPQFPGFTAPPPARMLSQLQGQAVTVPRVPAIRMESNSQQVPGITPSVQEKVRIFTSPILELNSEHMVYVSYVEDGPSSFAIQLQAAEGMLSTVMHEINNAPAVPLTQPLMPGSVCIGRFTEDLTLCRAVVMAVLDDKCRLYYVDFGNSEILPYSEVFELPQQFINPKVMALRFCLAGLRNLTITDELKSYFKELVTEKLLRLRVVAPEGPPIKQYGELYLNGANVLDLLVKKMKEKQVPCSFPVMPTPSVGTRESVKVSYVVSASSFYVQLETNAEALKSVMLAIEAICSGAAPFLEVDDLRIGLPCCAQYSEDEKWYRAKILSFSSNLVEVMYVDYGNSDSVPLSSLKHIDQSLVKILNPQAIQCCLRGFQDNVNEKLADEFENMILDKTLTMVVMDTLPNNVILVELYSGSLGSCVSVAAQLLSNSTAQETTRTQNQLSMHSSPAENNEWQEASTEASSEIHQGSQSEKKQQVWCGGRERSNQQESRSLPQCREALPSLKGLSWRYSQRKPCSGENESEWKSWDKGGSGGSKPWQNKDRANWRQENGVRSARGKWAGQGDEERSKGNNRGDFKKSWNRDEDDNNRNRGGSWKMDEGGGQNRKWNNGKDGGVRRNRWQDNNDDTQRRSGPGDSSSKWRGKRADENNSESRGGHKPWSTGNYEQSGKRYDFQKNNQNENVKTEVWGGNMQAATQKWDDSGAQSTVSGSIPEAAVKIGDVKPVEVVFLASPEEFCVQMTSESSKLTSVMKGIASKYGSGGGNPVPSARLRTGTACVAPYSEDGIMYRGIIESVDSISAVVLFCDYGNRQEVTLDKIKDISNEYLSLPIQGLTCKLQNAKPQNGVSWSEDEIVKFTTLTEEKKLQAYFVRKSNGVYEVVLTDIETGSDLNDQFCAIPEQVQDVGSKVGDSQNYELASPDQRYLLQKVTPETEHMVAITWFVNPEQFYCQMVSSQLAIKELMDAIQSAYYSKPPVTAPVEVGSPVIAKFLTDGVLYRAEVKEVLDTSSLIVQFVDYGNCDIVKQNDVWHIEARFMDLPKQALSCCLRGVEAPDSQWSRGDKGVDKYFEAEKFCCTFHNCEQNKYSVSLMSEGKSIADQLLEDGLAVAQAVHSKTVKTADTCEMFLDFSLLPGQIIAAHITCVESVSKFFVHLNPTLANRIQALVDEYVQNPENIQPVGCNNLAVNSLCLASRDGVQWYRGEIVDFSTTGTFIKFIDIGDYDQIPLDKVLVIPPDLTNYYAQAVECHVIRRISLTVAPSMDVILSVDSVDRERLFVTVFSMEGRTLELLEDTDLSEVDPVCPLPVMSKKMKVWVSHVEGPDCFWLQRICDSNTLAELLEKMYVFYMAEGKDIDLEVSVGKLCAAKSVIDDQWYRGKIVSVDVSNGTCTVLFIDYGNSETIPAAHVKELDASLFIPNAQAICAALAVKFDDYEQITSELLKMTSEKELTAVFGLKNDNKWLVDLFVEGASVSKKLVDLGLVKEFEAHLFRSKLKVGTCHAVFVSHIDSPYSFWVQKAEDSQEILTFQRELQMAANMMENMTSVPPVGTMCICMFAEAWYRAVVLESDLLVTVRFIDYGNVDDIDIASEHLKALPEKLQDIPAYAAECTLLGNNEGYKFHVGAAEKMEVLVGSTEKPATIHIISDEGIKYVELISADGKNVLMDLVNEGLSTKTELVKENCVTDTQATDISAVGVQITDEITTGETQVTEEVSVYVDTKARSDTSTVFVSYINSPSEFWIQYKYDTSKIEETENRLLEIESFPVLDEIVEGALCAAEFTDGQWYRAKVIQVTNEIEVFFLDYGNHSVAAELRSLPEDLLRVPQLAKRCSLRLPHGVTEWSTAAKEMFIKRAGGGCTQFQVDILEEGNCAVVSLLQGGQKIEDELLNLCLTVDKVSTTCVNPPKLYARISHAVSPSEFWIQFENSLSRLDEISSKLAESEGFPTLSDTEEGVLCVAQFPDDGRWYRASIISHADDCFVVMYVDFGNTATSTELRELPDELKDIPPLAKKCSLSFSTDVLQFTETVSGLFMDIVGEEGEVFEIEIIRDGDPALVSMWHNGQKVEDELLKIGKTEEKNISAVESETFVETWPHGTGEDSVYNEGKVMDREIEDSNENKNVKQEEVKDGCNTDHSEGFNELDMSEKYGDGTEKITQDEIGQVEIEEKEEHVAKNVANFGEQDEENILDQNVSEDIVCNVQNIPLDIKEDHIEDTACSDFTSEKAGENKETMLTENTKTNCIEECTKDVALHSTICVNPPKLYACISHVVSPSEFWIQFENSLSRLDEISSKLAESEGFPTLSDTEEGVLCVAQFPDDGRWYRASIISHADDCFVVMYVDFGNTATSTELRELPDELKDIPPLAKKCSLSFSTDVLQFTETVSGLFMDIVGEEGEVFEIEIIRDGDPALVSMWHNGQKVEDELLKIGKTEEKNISAVESETFVETWPHGTGEDSVYNEGKVMDREIEESNENKNVKQEKVKEGCNTDHSEGFNELDMSEKYGDGTEKITQDEIGQVEIEEKEEHVAKNVANFGEQDEENILDQNVSEDIVCNVQNIPLDIKDQIEDKAGSDFTSQETEDCKASVSRENIKISSVKESAEHVSDSLNICTGIKTDDESGESQVTTKNSHAKPLSLHLQRTHHTEELVKEINIEMKTPSEALSTTFATQCSERIVPPTVSIEISKEELLDAVLNRSASLELMHEKEIVPGYILQSRLIDTEKDGTKSAPSTPLVSSSEKFLQRVSLSDEFWQRTPSNPKLTHNDRIVPGSISRREPHEEIRPFTPKLPHAEKIVPGSISRGISDEELGSMQLQAAVVEAHEHNEDEAAETPIAEEADAESVSAL